MRMSGERPANRRMIEIEMEEERGDRGNETGEEHEERQGAVSDGAKDAVREGTRTDGWDRRGEGERDTLEIRGRERESQREGRVRVGAREGPTRRGVRGMDAESRVTEGVGERGTTLRGMEGN